MSFTTTQDITDPAEYLDELVDDLIKIAVEDGAKIDNKYPDLGAMEHIKARLGLVKLYERFANEETAHEVKLHAIFAKSDAERLEEAAFASNPLTNA